MRNTATATSKLYFAVPVICGNRAKMTSAPTVLAASAVGSSTAGREWPRSRLLLISQTVQQDSISAPDPPDCGQTKAACRAGTCAGDGGTLKTRRVVQSCVQVRSSFTYLSAPLISMLASCAALLTPFEVWPPVQALDQRVFVDFST